MNIRNLTHSDVLRILPERETNTHKGCFGRLLLLCGSVGYTGAAALAAMGALRSGAGLVYLGVPESIYSIEAIKLNEAIVFPLPDENGKLAADAVDQIKAMLPQMDAVLLGPGMGCSAGTLCVTQYVLENFTKPVVLDADGINVLTDHKLLVRRRTGVTVMTPHQGEFERFSGASCTDRVNDALLLARDLGIIVVLKGYETVITNGSDTYVNKTGNPGMATGGSGDVLSGIIASLIGQGLLPLEAAACGVWLHGAAGDICASEIGQYGMLPSDMIDVLPRLMK